MVTNKAFPELNGKGLDGKTMRLCRELQKLIPRGSLFKMARASFLFALLLIAACATPAAKVQPPLSLPEKFSSSGELPLPGQWWLSFEDPRLNALMEKAIANNFNLRVAWDRFSQVEALARAAGASLSPAIEGRVGASHTAQRTEGGISSTAGTNYRSNISLGIFASYELDLWGRIRSRRDAALLDLKASREQLKAAAVTLSALVAASWYDLVEQQGQLALLNEQMKLNEDMLELVTLRFRQGLTGAADVLQQRQMVESRRGDIIAVEARAAVLTHQLAILLGRQPTDGVTERVATPVQLPPLPATDIPARVIQSRPDIRAAFYNIQAADRRVAAALADRFPRISLTAGTDTSAGTVLNLFNNWLATLGANLVQPIFDAGLRRAEVDRTRAVVSERLNIYGQALLTALGEVEDALVQERKQREFIDSLNRQLEVSAQVIERTRHSYMHGAVDFLRVLDAMQRHQTLQRQQLQARRQLIQFRINLCRALGGGWEMGRPESLTLSGKNLQN